MVRARQSAPTVWVLIDDRAGNTNQAVGVAEALGLPFTLKNVRYNKKVRLPNFLRGASLKGVDLSRSDKLDKPWPDIVISAGRRLAPIARYVKKQADDTIFLTQIMSPGNTRGFDLVAIPEHDNPSSQRHILQTVGAPNRISKDLLDQATQMWAKTLEEEGPPPPHIALLVGGDTKKGKFTPAHAENLGTLASNLANATRASLLITTSRRTSDEALKALKDALDCPYYFHNPNVERANPYNAFLAVSKAIIVTGDSVSMCSEACSTGKPVYIFAPKGIIPAKHKRLHKTLYKQELAEPLTDEIVRNARFFTPAKAPLNAAHSVAEHIKHLYFG